MNGSNARALTSRGDAAAVTAERREPRDHRTDRPCCTRALPLLRQQMPGARVSLPHIAVLQRILPAGSSQELCCDLARYLDLPAAAGKHCAVKVQPVSCCSSRLCNSQSTTRETLAQLDSACGPTRHCQRACAGCGRHRTERRDSRPESLLGATPGEAAAQGINCAARNSTW